MRTLAENYVGLPFDETRVTDAMTFSALDSALTGPLFATDAMRAVFSDRARLAAMLRTEAALARAEAAHGFVAKALAPAIEQDHARRPRPRRPRSRHGDGRRPGHPLRQGGAGEAAGEAARRLPLRHHHPGHRRHRPRPADGGGLRPDRRRPPAPSSPACRGWPPATARRPAPAAPTASTPRRSPSATSPRSGSPASPTPPPAFPALRQRALAVSLGGPVGTLAGLGDKAGQGHRRRRPRTRPRRPSRRRGTCCAAAWSRPARGSRR